ncbi:hypothetical protein SAPIO_CDS0131 [Scedosporium apiospermum]|uniref:Phosphatidylethanolamine-binding protein n=1 Tax=Pseudallescheria apiosperma TaxID=563466 RepID=A0A084GHL0_PSEDA|nr:uncharacterized protein SAPIO_CDS0131 [Scedosporium apiospermum]KEZ46822.1 hypothetical protein SAPIO_CDS0131 [Scedosporium apiospermum]
MYMSLSNMLGLALSSCALVSASASSTDDTMIRRQVNANSVSTADFKSRFEQSGIVPEVIAALDPAVSFYASYKTSTGQDALLVPGSTLTVAEAAFPFEFSVENLGNATNITTSTRYLIYLLDADAPSRNDPSARNLRHYLAGNYTLSNTPSSVLPTAQRLFLPSAASFPFTPYQPPQPAANTGVHRFIYALYTQPPQFNLANFDSVGMSPETSNWSLPEWRMQLGLGPAIGATFFTIDTGANNGEGTSGQVDTVAQGGVTAAASGLSSPMYPAALTALTLAARLMV